MATFLKKGRTNCWPWLGSADEAPNRKSKMACDNPNCCNPRHVVESSGKDVESDESPQETVDSLRQACKDAGIPFDKRWGIERLTEVIEEATNPE